MFPQYADFLRELPLVAGSVFGIVLASLYTIRVRRKSEQILWTTEYRDAFLASLSRQGATQIQTALNMKIIDGGAPSGFTVYGMQHGERVIASAGDDAFLLRQASELPSSSSPAKFALA